MEPGCDSASGSWQADPNAHCAQDLLRLVSLGAVPGTQDSMALAAGRAPTAVKLLRQSSNLSQNQDLAAESLEHSDHTGWSRLQDWQWPASHMVRIAEYICL